ncbi:MAG: hypothetical protein WBO17_01815 [Sphingorhabdus sp.]
MFTPISKLLVLVFLATSLASCGGEQNDAALKGADAQAGDAAALSGKIECALAGSANFERSCTTERIAGANGQLLIIRHADGGFRRFNILTDGRGLAPADGFDETKIDLVDNGMIEVSSGDDKYRLPAQIKKPETSATEDTG